MRAESSKLSFSNSSGNLKVFPCQSQPCFILILLVIIKNDFLNKALCPGVTCHSKSDTTGHSYTS